MECKPFSHWSLWTAVLEQSCVPCAPAFKIRKGFLFTKTVLWSGPNTMSYLIIGALLGFIWQTLEISCHSRLTCCSLLQSCLMISQEREFCRTEPLVGFCFTVKLFYIELLNRIQKEKPVRIWKDFVENFIELSTQYRILEFKPVWFCVFFCLQ